MEAIALKVQMHNHTMEDIRDIADDQENYFHLDKVKCKDL